MFRMTFRVMFRVMLGLWVASGLLACSSDGGGESNTVEVVTLDPPSTVVGWTRLADMPRKVGRFAAVQWNGKLYVIAGYDRESALQIYDIASDTWSLGAELAVGTDNVAAVAYDGKIYAFGGEAAHQLQVYDIASNQWSFAARIPEPRFAAIAVIMGNAVHAASGWNYDNVNSNSLVTHRTFDLASGQHSNNLLAPMMTARNCAVAANLGDVLYVSGGRQPGIRNHDATALASTEMYDAFANGWDVRASMPTARACAAGAVLNSKWYVLGGELPAPFIHNVVERYDAAGNSWTTLPAMPYRATGHGAVAVNNSIYVMGGYSANADGRALQAVNYLYRYTPVE